MAFVNKPGQGALFNNSKDKDSQPDMKGVINIDGTDYEIAAWKKQGQKGEFLSLSAKLKTAKPEKQETKPASRPQIPHDMNDEIPF